MKVLRYTAAVLVAFAALSTAFAADKAPEFVRIDHDADALPRALQLSIVTYVPVDGDRDLRVDLVSAIHIGDLAYYHELNDRFRDYELVLYELVAPEEAAASRQFERRGGVLSTAFVGMTKLLGLSYQLDGIEYDRPNFVHADLTPDQLSEQMQERGESLYVYFWRLYFKAIDDYARDPLGLRDIELYASLVSAGHDGPYKTLLAHQLADPEQMQNVLGADADTALIGARNQHAIDVLKREVRSGASHVAIFYGAAHMPDLEQRLIDQLGLTYHATDWVDAWQLGL